MSGFWGGWRTEALPQAQLLNHAAALAISPPATWEEPRAIRRLSSQLLSCRVVKKQFTVQSILSVRISEMREDKEETKQHK
jgi:hypothetical protein